MPQFSLPPVFDEKIFERLMCDLMNHLHQTTNFMLYGVSGQSQNGIDVLSVQHETVVQCAWKDLNKNDTNYTQKLLQKLLKDFDSAYKSDTVFRTFIFASTYKNDTHIHDYCALMSLNAVCVIEYWSWDKIADYIASIPFLLKKYYPQFFSSSLSIGRIAMDNSCNYSLMKREYCYELGLNPEKSDYPIFDFSFLNNSEDVVLLNSISVKGKMMNIAHAGTPLSPVGLLDVSAQFDIEPNIPFIFGIGWGAAKIILKAPFYISPKHPARIQVRLLKKMVSFSMLYFEFEFDSVVLTTPTFWFNSDEGGAPDYPNDLIRALEKNRNKQKE